jgi:hypothetical protein
VEKEKLMETTPKQEFDLLARSLRKLSDEISTYNPSTEGSRNKDYYLPKVREAREALDAVEDFIKEHS